MRGNFLKHLIDEEPEPEPKAAPKVKPSKPSPKPSSTPSQNFKANSTNYNNNNNYQKNWKKEYQHKEGVQQRQWERITTNSPNLALAISKLDKPKISFTLEDVIEIFRIVSKSEDIKDDKVFAKLIVLLIMKGEWNLVQELLQIMHNREVPFTSRVYQSLIGGYLRNNYEEAALQLFQEMKDANIPDSYPVYRSFLKHYVDTKDEQNMINTINNSGKFTLDDDIMYDIINTSRARAIDVLIVHLKKHEKPNLRILLAAYIKKRDFIAVEQIVDEVGITDFVLNYFAIFVARGGMESLYRILEKKNYALTLDQMVLFISNAATKRSYDFVYKVISDTLQRKLPIQEAEVLRQVQFPNRGGEEPYVQFLANITLIFSTHAKREQQKQ